MLPAIPTRERVRPPDPRSRAGPMRRGVHLIVSAAGWVLFVWAWIDVLGRAHGAEVSFTLTFLALSLAIIFAATSLWIAYNVARARQYLPRLVVTRLEEDEPRSEEHTSELQSR